MTDAPVFPSSSGSESAPDVYVACSICGGEGHILRGAWVYEAGCGFGHDDVDSVECDACNGSGGTICEADGTNEIERLMAREECARRGIDPDEVCADGGVTAWMVVDQELTR